MRIEDRDYDWWFVVVAGAITLAAIIAGAASFLLYALAENAIVSGVVGAVLVLVLSAKFVQHTVTRSP